MSGFLQQIVNNCQTIDRQATKKLLLLIEEERLYVGDTVKKFSQIRFCRYYFPNAAIYINFNNKSHLAFYQTFLKNNPYVEQVLDLPWDEIPFHEYEVVTCLTPNEEKLLKLLEHRYNKPDAGIRFSTAIFSRSEMFIRLVMPGRNKCEQIFPLYIDMANKSGTPPEDGTDEIFISPEEKLWGNSWLEEQGVKSDERVGIFVDVTTNMNKALKIDVHFDVLKHFLLHEKNKALIYDERGIDKESFYHGWLGPELAAKIIFSKQQPFRNDLCVMASDYIKFIFGPCTGLLHCASGIYNHLFYNGLSTQQLPLMIVYTGRFADSPEYTPDLWWRDSPLLQCLVLRQKNGIPQISLLAEMDEAERSTQEDLLSCKNYTAEMIIDFIAKNL